MSRTMEKQTRGPVEKKRTEMGHPQKKVVIGVSTSERGDRDPFTPPHVASEQTLWADFRQLLTKCSCLTSPRRAGVFLFRIKATSRRPDQKTRTDAKGFQVSSRFLLLLTL